MKTSRSLRSNNEGFTIVELMIATAVLSIILLLVTVIMISIGDLYYKGISQSQTQDNARSIADQVAQDLKYNDLFTTGQATAVVSTTAGPQTVDVYAYCVGGVRYSFALDAKLGTAGGTDTDKITPLLPHVLWRDDGSDTSDSNGFSSSPGTGCTPINITTAISHDSSGVEMIAPNTRLTAFCIGTIIAGNQCSNDSASPYTITVGVAFGDIDLLTVNGSPLTLNKQYVSGVACKGATGDQFCATSALATTVDQRVTTSGN